MSFKYGLVNTGESDGIADVTIFADGNPISSDSHFVKEGEQTKKFSSVSLNDCDKHQYGIKVVGQRK